MECIFCNLVKEGAIEVYNGKKAFAFMDINPRAKGHCIVIPKRHVPNFEGLDNEEIGEIFSSAKEICKSMGNNLNAKSFSLIINSGPFAGQRIEHIALQIIPRYEDEETSKVPAGAIFKNIETNKEEIMRLGNSIKIFGKIDETKSEEREKDKEGAKERRILGVKKSKHGVEFV